MFMMTFSICFTDIGDTYGVFYIIMGWSYEQEGEKEKDKRNKKTHYFSSKKRLLKLRKRFFLGSNDEGFLR